MARKRDGVDVSRAEQFAWRAAWTLDDARSLGEPIKPPPAVERARQGPPAGPSFEDLRQAVFELDARVTEAWAAGEAAQRAGFEPIAALLLRSSVAVVGLPAASGLKLWRLALRHGRERFLEDHDFAFGLSLVRLEPHPQVAEVVVDYVEADPEGLRLFHIGQALAEVGALGEVAPHIGAQLARAIQRAEWPRRRAALWAAAAGLWPETADAAHACLKSRHLAERLAALGVLAPPSGPCRLREGALVELIEDLVPHPPPQEDPDGCAAYQELLLRALGALRPRGAVPALEVIRSGGGAYSHGFRDWFDEEFADAALALIDPPRGLTSLRERLRSRWNRDRAAALLMARCGPPEVASVAVRELADCPEPSIRDDARALWNQHFPDSAPPRLSLGPYEALLDAPPSESFLRRRLILEGAPEGYPKLLQKLLAEPQSRENAALLMQLLDAGTWDLPLRVDPEKAARELAPFGEALGDGLVLSLRRYPGGHCALQGVTAGLIAGIVAPRHYDELRAAAWEGLRSGSRDLVGPASALLSKLGPRAEEWEDLWSLGFASGGSPAGAWDARNLLGQIGPCERLDERLLGELERALRDEPAYCVDDLFRLASARRPDRVAALFGPAVERLVSGGPCPGAQVLLELARPLRPLLDIPLERLRAWLLPPETPASRFASRALDVMAPVERPLFEALLSDPRASPEERGRAARLLLLPDLTNLKDGMGAPLHQLGPVAGAVERLLEEGDWAMRAELIRTYSLCREELDSLEPWAVRVLEEGPLPVARRMAEGLLLASERGRPMLERLMAHVGDPALREDFEEALGLPTEAERFWLAPPPLDLEQLDGLLAQLQKGAAPR